MHEDEFQQALLNVLTGQFDDFEVDTQVPVPYRHIYVGEGADLVQEVWCSKQDIAIYRSLISKEVPYNRAAICDQGVRLVNVKLEKDNAQNTKPVGMPFVIIELKPRQPDSHTLLAYAEKADMIRSVFPYCRFVFCQLGKISKRSFRHGHRFDDVISVDNPADTEEMAKFMGRIQGHLDVAMESFLRLC